MTRRDRFAAPYPSVIHDFMVTRNYVMFPVLPLTGDLERAKKGLPPMAWEPTKGAFIGVMKRNASVGFDPLVRNRDLASSCTR